MKIDSHLCVSMRLRGETIDKIAEHFDVTLEAVKYHLGMAFRRSKTTAAALAKLKADEKSAANPAYGRYRRRDDLRERIKSLGLTMTEVSIEAGVSGNYLCDVLAGRRALTYKFAQELAWQLQIRASDVLRGAQIDSARFAIGQSR